MKKPKHGGKRKGAGRKPLAEPKKVITVRLKPDVAERFKVIREGNKLSQSGQVAKWIEGEKI